MAQNKTNQIRSLLQVLGQDFTLSHNPNSRKGGLIGLAATAIALGKVGGWQIAMRANNITVHYIASNIQLWPSKSEQERKPLDKESCNLSHIRYYSVKM